MPYREVPPEAVERLRSVEPLACPVCRAERGRSDYRLDVVDRGTSARQTGILVRCSVGHASVAAFVPLDGLVFRDIVPVDPPAPRGYVADPIRPGRHGAPPRRPGRFSVPASSWQGPCGLPLPTMGRSPTLHIPLKSAPPPLRAGASLRPGA